MLPGLDPPDGSPAMRRAALARASDAELEERLVRLAIALRGSHDELAKLAGLPLAEVVASPFAVRAVALGVEVGATTAHHELRVRPDWPAIVEDAVRDPDHGTWDRGVLKTGKYQSFLADEPFATYDPSHSSKWGPHELLHRAARFFFRPGASKWDLYLGARLNELVPVVAWYGPDQVMRLDQGAFDRSHPLIARLDDARWLIDDDAALCARARRSVPILRAGLAHFERELAAIDEEIVRGMRVRVPHPFLDASSDATAYVVGHANRLELVSDLLESANGFRDVGEYRTFIEALFDRLLFGSIELDRAAIEERRRAAHAWDLAHRAAHFGEDLEDLEPEHPVFANGLEPHPASDAQLADGIDSIAPCTRSLFEELPRFDLFSREPLADRLARALTPDAAEMLRFERAIAFARRDDAIERLCEEDGEWIVRSEAFDVLSFEHAVVERHAAFSEGELGALERGPGAWLVGGWHDSVSVVPCPPNVARAWEHLALARRPRGEIVRLLEPDGASPEGWPSDGIGWLRELESAGAIGSSR